MTALNSIKVRTNFFDSLAWTLSFNGLFTVRSFPYCLEKARSGSCQDNTFMSFIWKGICPPKTEIFIWQLIKGTVLVCEVMWKFGMVNLANCECLMCGLVVESINHLFLTCVWSCELWRICMGWWGVHGCMNYSLIDWLNGWVGICPSQSRNRAWNVLFCAVVWTIWENRNRVVFRGSQPCLGLALDSVKFRVALWFKNYGPGSSCDLTLLMLDLNERCTDDMRSKVRRKEVWMPPANNELCFNVDGSSRGNPREAGIGGVLRDFSGKVLCLFSVYVGVVDSSTVEVMEIHKACQLISSNIRLVNRTITIISDSNSAVSWVNGKDFGNFKLVNLIYDIRSSLLHLKGLSVCFKTRGSNLFADSLAKGGSSNSGDRLEWSEL